ncbi:MAG TPA: flavodoxin family protein [Clostridia bacterium]|nr:flavodoxin family protein [Clostridia bacterium]
MKVLLVNGSPRQKGCTYTALTEVAKTLEKEGIACEIFQLGENSLSSGREGQLCEKENAYDLDESVQIFLDKSKDFDGFVFGSPVHYAAASGAITSFLDRVFSSGRKTLQFKPAATVVSARRAGATAALDQLNKYPTISQMPLVSSKYWNMVHGNTPDEVMKDLEGMQIMRTLGRNMAWMLKSLEAGRKAGIDIPDQENPVTTNFIR